LTQWALAGALVGAGVGGGGDEAGALGGGDDGGTVTTAVGASVGVAGATVGVAGAGVGAAVVAVRVSAGVGTSVALLEAVPVAAPDVSVAAPLQPAARRLTPTDARPTTNRRMNIVPSFASDACPDAGVARSSVRAMAANEKISPLGPLLLRTCTQRSSEPS
jgi:hypothetical protein